MSEVRHAASPAAAPGDDFSVVAAIDALDVATRAIAGELDLDRVLQLIVDSVRELVDARYAALGIIDASGRIEFFITSGISAADRAAIGPLPSGHGLLGLIIREARSYRIPNIAAHPDSYGFPEGHPPMRSFLGVPIRVGGAPTGNFYLTNKTTAPEFTERDLRLVEMFALHAGIAIQNARLHTRVQRLALVDERIRIGRDLHDGIIQGIYAVALSLEDVPDLMADAPAEASARIDRAIDRLNLTIGEIRQFIVALSSETVDIAVGARLASIADEVGLLSTSALKVDLDLDPAALARVDVDMTREGATQLVQIVREAVSNTLRHSNARRVTIALGLDGDIVVVTVDDDGHGFEPGAPRGAGHLGLVNLHDRAMSAGGSLEIRSAIGSGTRIIARLPLLPAEDSA
ncbi:MAG: GAF domain-containing protein [Chloroflexi bacterium]|nr:GAF domain-containing protein [Chloroflexota bacterium]